MPLVDLLGDWARTRHEPTPREPLDSPICPKPAYLAETVLRSRELALLAQYGFGGGAVVVAVIETLPKTPSVWSANPAV
jgi:hypothetical protein